MSDSYEQEKEHHRQHEIRKWEKKRPKDFDYEHVPTEEERIRHDRDMLEWANDYPVPRDPYENDRR